MSVEAMAMATISGPEKMVNTAIQSLVINRDFHPENAVKLLSGVKELVQFDSPNPYSESLAKSLALMSGMGIAPDYSDFTHSEIELKSVSDYLENLSSWFSAVRNEREEKSLTARNNKLVVEQLGHFSSFNVELGDLFAMKYLKFHFGRIPSETYKECMKVVDSRPDVYFVTSGRSENWVYGAYFAFPQSYTQIESIFSSLGFERIHIDVEGNVRTTANETIERLNAETDEAEKRVAEINREIEEKKASESSRLLLYYSWLRYMSDSFDMRSYAGRRHGRFYIIGWIPKADSEKFVKECESISGVACFLTEPNEVKDTPPPVKFKKGFFSDIYQPFLEMYGLPSYGEIDPRLFMALTYTLIFGIMFGDVGQGFALAVIGFLLWKLKNIWLGRIVGICGISSIVFGMVYGSLFGNEEILPWGFKVLENGNTMRILLIAVALGVVLIAICMIMNMINGIRQKDIGKILFSPNGVAGFVIYIGLAVAVVLKFAKGQNVFTAPFIIFIIIIPLFLLFAATPLTKLIKGEKDWMPESVGMFFVEGFFDLFEMLLSYVSNTVSFLRIGAYAISHAGMMMVVYLLSGGTNIAGIIFGNILVTGLETMLVCIQVLRLEYYEMFGRFYTGGGVKFSPKVIDYKTAEL
ncbi:MAG: ATPase V [Clostridiales bacterium]|nr:ATPase V [Clostridiales bacterium]